jgi:hypothetical protein
LLTKPEIKDSKPKDPKEALKGLASVSEQALDDYYWCKVFGRAEGKPIVWKYDNPFRYPTDEFEQLKTIILVMAAVEEEKERSAKIIKHDRPELPEDVKQKKLLRANLFHQAMSKKAS